MKTKQRIKMQKQRRQRVGRVRSKVWGTAARPRLAVHRSLRYFSAQVINDDKSETMLAVHQKDLKEKMKPVAAAAALGQLVAKLALEKKITSVVFDRRHYKYHGRLQAFADAAREGGLKF